MKCETINVKNRTYIIRHDGALRLIDVLQVINGRPDKKTYHGFSEMPVEEYVEFMAARAPKPQQRLHSGMLR
jgi:hypothetical protein